MKIGIPALALVAALSMVAAPAAAAGSQTWYLGGEFDLVAERGSVPPPTTDPEFPSNHVLIANGQVAIWEANEAALVDVAFGAGNFDWSLRLATGNFIGSYTLWIGVSNCNGLSFTGYGSETVLGPGVAGQFVETGTIPTSGFTVPTGYCLALKIQNDADVEGKPLRVMYSVADSNFTSPSSDPGYPTPELGTVLLLGAGLGVVATVALRRK